MISWGEPEKRNAMPQRKIDQELVSAARAGIAGRVSELLARGADPRSCKSAALRVAAYSGHEECVRLLLPMSDPGECESYALRGRLAMDMGNA